MNQELVEATKLTVIIGADARYRYRSLYDAVMKILREHAVAGATVTKGVMNFGHRRIIHSTMNEITMENLPLIIEVVDERENLIHVASLIAEMVGDRGVIELQPTHILRLGLANKVKRR